MRILTKEKMKNAPVGTVFALYKPSIFDGWPSIITSHYNGDEGWRSELSLCPFQTELGTNFMATNWAVGDSCWFEYSDDDLFAVFDKLEIQTMINVLIYGLSNCQSYFNQNYYCVSNNPIDDEKFDELINGQY